MITPFGLRHVLLMRELQSTSVALDLKSALLEPETPLHAALRGYFLKSGSGVFTYVLRTTDCVTNLHGFAQARARKSGLMWNVVCMAPDLDSSEDAATIWYRLLLHLCIAAGERRVQRLSVRLPEDSPAEEVFRQASFAVYCHERVFWRSSAEAIVGSLSPRMQPVRPENRLDVQRLFHKVTPRLVLQAEELSDSRCDSQPLQVPFSDAVQGHVLYDRRGETLGYLHILLSPRGSWLRLMVHPDAYDSAAEMLDHALAVLGNHLSQPLYCAVRGYEGGVQAALEDRGFTLANTHSLLVKHTTVRVRKPLRKLVPALEKRAEAAPTVSRSETEV